MTQKHKPVLAEEVLKLLSPKKGEAYLDVTAGYGGHATSILECTDAPEKAVLVDRDRAAIEYLSHEFKTANVELIHSDFLAAATYLVSSGKQFDIILADLGVSSQHLDNLERGFSFSHSGPLDMRMDQSADLSAYRIVNEY